MSLQHQLDILANKIAQKLFFKVRQSRNYFFKPTFLRKNKQMNTFMIPQVIVSVRFLEEIEDKKKDISKLTDLHHLGRN